MARILRHYAEACREDRAGPGPSGRHRPQHRSEPSPRDQAKPRQRQREQRQRRRNAVEAIEYSTVPRNQVAAVLGPDTALEHALRKVPDDRQGRDPEARWWSITAYTRDHFLIETPSHRYSVDKSSAVRAARCA